MSQSPAFPIFRRPKDLALQAKPSPKPEPVPEPDDEEEDVVGLDRIPPLPAHSGHFPPKLPSQAAAADDGFPAPRIRERVTFVSMRVPNSLLDEVEAVCAQRGLDRTTVILHFVRQGLRRPFAPGNPAS